MLLKNELKKLYIKQYGLIVLLIVFIAKLLTSADLYKASYSDMLYEQQKYYLEYMQEYGGQLTDEKETAIAVGNSPDGDFHIPLNASNEQPSFAGTAADARAYLQVP